MGLTEIVKKRLELQNELRQIQKSFLDKKFDLNKKINECSKTELFLSNGLDHDKIKLARTVIYTEGNISRDNDEHVRIDQLAIEDIANGALKLKNEYFGIKEYSGFIQRDDHKYGFGPKYGSIIAEIGLKSSAMSRNITVEESDACIYFLKNFDKIFEIEKFKEVKR